MDGTYDDRLLAKPIEPAVSYLPAASHEFMKDELPAPKPNWRDTDHEIKECFDSCQRY